MLARSRCYRSRRERGSTIDGCRVIPGAIGPVGTEMCGLDAEGRSGWVAVLDLDEVQARWMESWRRRRGVRGWEQ